MLEIINRACEDKDHLHVKARDVIPDHEDDGTELTSDGDCVLGVHSLVFVSLTISDQILVDDARLNRASKSDKKFSIS